MNFALHFNAWRRATLGGYFADSELKAYFAILLVASFLVAFELYGRGEYDFYPAVRHATFHVVSNMTTTGFITTGFAHWGGFAPLLMILLGTIGISCAE